MDKSNELENTKNKLYKRPLIRWTVMVVISLSVIFALLNSSYDFLNKIRRNNISEKVQPKKNEQDENSKNEEKTKHIPDNVIDKTLLNSIRDSLNLADDLYGLGHHASAYRLYERTYQVIPSEFQRLINKEEIIKAKEKYRILKFYEAAYLMKSNLDTIKDILTLKGI